MEQRPLRLGDPVDDYCPRERRLTNHAIVAIVGDEIRQTRCSTCDAEHVYKGGKTPARKKKDTTAQLYDQVLANVTAGAVVKPAPAVAVAEPPVETLAAAAPPMDATVDATVATDTQPTRPPAPPVDEGWTLHRTLIRATLPRTEAPTPRPIPEFTMHQRNVRGSHVFRGGGMFDHNGNGGNGHDRSNGHDRGNGGHRSHPRGEGQPGAPNGQRPGGSRRRRRHKKPRPTN